MCQLQECFLTGDGGGIVIKAVRMEAIHLKRSTCGDIQQRTRCLILAATLQKDVTLLWCSNKSLRSDLRLRLFLLGEDRSWMQPAACKMQRGRRS